ncbi:hypothetical protein ACFYOF_20515 [Streptomyces sp. NPDC007148]|uniref:hypothetical protein n=1 Tax=unclassified Streptomyces TaxID=2593676 RepID=UPI0036B166AD
MFGPYRYDCPACGVTSEPYITRRAAERRGAGHRDRRHEGMHPRGEAIVSDRFRGLQGGERQAAAIVAALLLIALVTKFL